MRRLTMVAFGLLLGLAGCRPDDSKAAVQQELNTERIRRVQAEQKAGENEKRKDAWQTAATVALTGAVLLLVVGAGLGSMGKRDAGG